MFGQSLHYNVPVFIKSAHNKHVLDIEGGRIQAGTKVILWPKKKTGADNQMWVFTPDGFIASHANPNLVLDIEGNGGQGSKLIIWNRTGAPNQKFSISPNGEIVSMRGDGLVLDVEGASMNQGAKLIAWAPHGRTNQKFKVRHVKLNKYFPHLYPHATPNFAPGANYFYVPVGQPVYLESTFNNMVLDIKGGKIAAGTHVICWPKKAGAADNQLWILNADGTISSKANPNLVLDIAGNGGAGTKLIIWNKTGNPNQKWQVNFDGSIVTHRPDGLVLDVEGGSKKEGTHIIVWGNGGPNKPNQRFRIVPLF